MSAKKNFKNYQKNQAGNISLIIACSGFLTLEIFHNFWGIDGFLFRLLMTGFEASTVGAFADWFAISALYRKIPIPLIGRHTNIILRNREKLEEGIVKVVLNEWLSKEALKEKLKETNLVLILNDLFSKCDGEKIVDKLNFYEDEIKVKICEVIISYLEIQLDKEELRNYLIQFINKTFEENSMPKKFFIDLGKKFNLINAEKISEKILNLLKEEMIKIKNDPSSNLRISLENLISKVLRKIPDFLKSGFATLQKEPQKIEEINNFLKDFLEPVIDDLQPKIGEIVRTSLKKLSDEELIIFIKQKIDDDLQYIRLNGAVVGGIVGIILALIKEFFHIF